ncbi:MAG: hypothetical protein M3416_02460 [Acidobacteriota bacterium]|nr:hypothetical protein [Acidobacteriota bacterium]
MIKGYIGRTLRPALLAAAWALLAYSTLFGGFSVTLADIYGGQGGNLSCANLSSCGGGASCNSGGTLNNCTITCSDGVVISCPKR